MTGAVSTTPARRSLRIMPWNGAILWFPDDQRSGAAAVSANYETSGVSVTMHGVVALIHRTQPGLQKNLNMENGNTDHGLKWVRQRKLRYQSLRQNRGRKIPGKLVVVEGIDGSGKSTQIHLLEKWLSYNNLEVFLTEWNSSEMVKEITSRGKKKATLTPTTFSLLHATDFADRFERNIMPLLRAGYFVLADRYAYTAFARDVTRGCNPRWVRKAYSFALKPDIAFYFRVPIDVALDRVLAGRPKLKYYESGMDMGLSKDPYESYRIFQSRIIEQYESMVESEGFTIIDATMGIKEQQDIMRAKVEEVIPGGIPERIAEVQHERDA